MKNVDASRNHQNNFAPVRQLSFQNRGLDPEMGIVGAHKVFVCFFVI